MNEYDSKMQALTFFNYQKMSHNNTKYRVLPITLHHNFMQSSFIIKNSCLFQGLLGMYFILDENDSPIVESIGFLPILALVLFILTYCWGLGPLPWAIMGELFPIEVKAIASPIATAYCWGLSFLVTR